MTELAPHSGRRTRRDAESRPSIPDGSTPYAQYGTDGTSPGHHATASGYGSGGGYPAGDGMTGYLPPSAPAPGRTPSAYGAGPASPSAAPYAAYAPTAAPAPSYGSAAPTPYGAPTAPAAPPAPSGDPRGGPVSAPRAGGPAGPGGGGYGGGHGGGSRGSGGDDDGSMRGRHATEWGQGFERVVGWTLLGSLVPGVGLIAAGRRVLGWSVVAVWVLIAGCGLAIVLMTDPLHFAARLLLSHPERLTWIAGAMVLLGVLWGAHVVTTNVTLRRFATLTGLQSALSWALVAVLVGGGVASVVLRAQQVQLGGQTITSMFSDAGGGGGLSTAAKRPDASKRDPWASTPRVNVLLIGSDAGADRTGLRTDSLIVASIDTHTGRTVLFSLPRNMEHVPFPEGTQQAIDYPQGYYCAQDACMINALWQFGVEHKNQYYKGVKNPGLKATVDGVQQALGLTIDDYAMIDLRGFMQFVDAVGGLEINVQKRIPVGGHHDASGREVGVTSYIEAGKQKLDGYHALWFARSRSDSDDFVRMGRQRCVIAAMSQQIDPQTVALHITDILQAAKQNIRTSIPVADLDAWVTLAMKVKKSHLQSVSFTPSITPPGNPDFEVIHTRVQNALTAPVPTAKPKPATPSPSATTKKHTTKAPTATVVENGDAVDTAAVC